MPHDGKCAICGYRAPITCFLEAAGNGELVVEFIKLPQEVQAPFYKYLSLFKPASGRAMQNSKSIRLTREMVTLVTTGYVRRKGRVDRPCPPALWARGIERMLEQAAGLDLPMENHNYLRRVVYQLADQADSRRERDQHQAESNGSARAERMDARTRSGGNGGPVSPGDGLSQLERQYLAAHGHLPGAEETQAIRNVQELAAWAKRTFGEATKEVEDAPE